MGALLNTWIRFWKSKKKGRWILDAIKKIFYKAKYSLILHKFGKNCTLEKSARLRGGKYIEIADNVAILYRSRIEAIDCLNGQVFKPEIKIGEGTTIGQNLHMISAKKVSVGKRVLISANVFISDVDHMYTDIERSVISQPLFVKETIIGDDCFIGYNAVILAGTKLGKHCVVGANSVVRGEFEDYSVIVGAPAKVIKTYNLRTGVWENEK